MKMKSNPFRVATNNSVDNSSSHGTSVNYNSFSEKELWQLFKSGDEGAFVAIYQSHVDNLYNYGLQFTSDKEGIKDCIQDFFIYLRQKRDKLSETDCIKPYLLLSYRRRLFSYLKNIQKQRANQDKYCHEVRFQFEFSAETLLIERQFSDSQIGALNRALKNISDKEKEIIYLFYFENLSYSEIAKIQGFTHVSSARRLIYNTLKKLRTVFKMNTILFLAGLSEWFKTF